MNQSERILQLEAEVKRYREAMIKAQEIFAPMKEIDGDMVPMFWNHDHAKHIFEAYSVLAKILSTPTPSTSGILELARAGHLHINRGRNWAIVREAAGALSPEEIKMLDR